MESFGSMSISEASVLEKESVSYRYETCGASL